MASCGAPGWRVVLYFPSSSLRRGDQALKELTESAGDIRFGEAQEVDLKALAGLNRVYAVERP